MSLPPVPTALARPLASLRRFVAPFAERLVELELFDRAVALASQAFVALIPFMVVVAALTPYGERSSSADSIIRRFELTGDTAAAVEQVFSQPAEVQSTLTTFGVLLLIVSALSFCRALQRTYERAWRLRRLGMRSTPATCCGSRSRPPTPRSRARSTRRRAGTPATRAVSWWGSGCRSSSGCGRRPCCWAGASSGGRCGSRAR